MMDERAYCGLGVAIGILGILGVYLLYTGPYPLLSLLVALITGVGYGYCFAKMLDGFAKKMDEITKRLEGSKMTEKEIQPITIYNEKTGKITYEGSSLGNLGVTMGLDGFFYPEPDED